MVKHVFFNICKSLIVHDYSWKLGNREKQVIMRFQQLPQRYEVPKYHLDNRTNYYDSWMIGRKKDTLTMISFDEYVVLRASLEHQIVPLGFDHISMITERVNFDFVCIEEIRFWSIIQMIILIDKRLELLLKLSQDELALTLQLVINFGQVIHFNLHSCKKILFAYFCNRYILVVCFCFGCC